MATADYVLQRCTRRTARRNTQGGRTMGLKSSAAATAAFAGVNGATYAASPDAAPLVLGVTMVLYLVFICFMAIMGAAGFMFGNFEDEDDRQDFIRQVNDPEARARRSKKRGLR